MLKNEYLTADLEGEKKKKEVKKSFKIWFKTWYLLHADTLMYSFSIPWRIWLSENIFSTEVWTTNDHFHKHH